jgi:hypothetical protein
MRERTRKRHEARIAWNIADVLMVDYCITPVASPSAASWHVMSSLLPTRPVVLLAFIYYGAKHPA